MKYATREAVLVFALDAWGDEPDFPFDRDDVSAVLRHDRNRKWYALLMRLPYRRLGLERDGETDILTLKADPLLVDALVKRPGFRRAYHMNKTRWVTALLDGGLTMDDVVPLLEMSRNLTEKKS